MARMLSDCHPRFRQKIETIAAAGGKLDTEVYEVWLVYSRQCSSMDQSALIEEFVEWNATLLNIYPKPVLAELAALC